MDAADVDGITALMSAAQHGRLAVMEKLLAAGAAVDAKNRAGQTALFLVGHPLLPCFHTC